jgi:2'-5' RNA ligase
MEKKRLFISLDFPENIIEILREIQKEIKVAKICDCKFTEQEQLHLTLKFLGEVDEKGESLIINKLRKVSFSPFDAKLGGLGVIKKDEEIKIIYINLVSKKLLELQKLIDDSLNGLFNKNDNFLSHITLCRVKKITNKKKFIDFLADIKIEDQIFTINHFSLKESYLKSDGPEHVIIERYVLK